MVSYNLLIELKKNIIKLTKGKQDALYYNCLVKLKDLNITTNQNGIFFNLKKISDKSYKLILDFLEIL